MLTCTYALSLLPHEFRIEIIEISTYSQLQIREGLDRASKSEHLDGGLAKGTKRLLIFYM